jgi:hypothetical protein
MEQQLPQELFDALNENNKILEEANSIISETSDDIDNKKVVEKNVISKPKVRASLTGDERKRYSLIGEELFKPFFKKLAQMKKKESMLIKDDVASIDKGLKEQYENKEEKKKNKSGIFGILFLALAGFIIFKDEILAFFGRIKETFGEKISSILSGIKDTFSFPDISSLPDDFKKMWDSALSAFGNVAGPIIKETTEKFKDFWNKLKFPDDLSKTLREIPNALISGLESLTSYLKGIFQEDNPEYDKDEEEEEAEETTNAVANAAASEVQQKASAAINDLVANSNSAISSYSLRDAYAKIPQHVREELARLGISGVMSDDETKIDPERANAEYIRKISAALIENAQPVAGGLSDSRIENIQDAIDDALAEMGPLDFREPLSPEDLQELVTNVKENANIANLDEETLMQQIAQINQNFGQLQSLDNHLALAPVMANGGDDAFQTALTVARQSGRMAEFSFVEARAIILDTTERLINSFNTFNNEMAKAFAEGAASYYSRLERPNITITPEIHPPANISFNTCEIYAIDAKNIKILNDRITELTEESIETIMEQNKILDDIKVLLSTVPLQSQGKPSSSHTNLLLGNPERNGTNHVAQGAYTVSASLMNSITAGA